MLRVHSQEEGLEPATAWEAGLYLGSQQQHGKQGCKHSLFMHVIAYQEGHLYSAPTTLSPCMYQPTRRDTFIQPFHAPNSPKGSKCLQPYDRAASPVPDDICEGLLQSRAHTCSTSSWPPVTGGAHLTISPKRSTCKQPTRSTSQHRMFHIHHVLAQDMVGIALLPMWRFHASVYF